MSIAPLIRATRPERVLARLFAVDSDVLPSGVSGAPRSSIDWMNELVSSVTVCAASSGVVPVLTLARASSSDVTHEVAVPAVPRGPVGRRRAGAAAVAAAAGEQRSRAGDQRG